MKHRYLLISLIALAACAVARAQDSAQSAQSAQSAEQFEEQSALRVSEEHARIRQSRATEQAGFAVLEAQCYRRFAVNDCLIDVRARRRDVLGDLRRQEISLNDAERKRRAAEQILRSDARAVGTR